MYLIGSNGLKNKANGSIREVIFSLLFINLMEGEIFMKICINAGHGNKGTGNSNSNGIDPGAIGPSGYQEYIETKEIADLISTKLKFNGIETLVIQDGDLWDVTNQNNAWKSDYFVSVHCNSFSSDSHGVETFSLASTGKGRVLAESVHKELVTATGLFDRSLKTANYHVLSETDCPAILTEIGFISNPKEEALMKDSVWDDKVSNAIARGVCNFIGVTYKQNTTSTTQMTPTIPQTQGGIKMKSLVTYKYEPDSHASFYLASFLQCPIIPADLLTQDIIDNCENIYQVGGYKINNKFKLISGNDRYDSIIAVLKYIKKI